MKNKELAKRLTAIEKHLGIEPRQVELEFGKWYKNNNGEVGTLLFLENANNSFFSGYGFCEGSWIGKEDTEGYSGWTTQNWTLATPEEVKSALVEEAKKRYSGKKAKCLHGCLEFDSEKHLDRFEFDLGISQKNTVVRYYAEKGGVGCIFHNGKWAEIIPQPKSILDGKVAISVQNEREFNILMKHYEEKGWKSHELSLKHEGFGITHHIIEYNDCFLRIDESNIIATNHYAIIPFYEFAAEVGIKVPVFIMKSEDGVDLYEGDKLYYVWDIHHKWVLLNKYTIGLEVVDDTDFNKHINKAFATREAAEKWIEEQNKPKEIIFDYPTIKVTVDKKGFEAKSKIDGRSFTFETEDVQKIAEAIQQINNAKS